MFRIESDSRPHWSELAAEGIREAVYHDSWRGTDRIARYVGGCVGCGRATWEFDDGENDPRGILGDHATNALCAVDFGFPAEAPDVPLCALCGNEYDPYKYAEGVATRRWTTWAARHAQS